MTNQAFDIGEYPKNGRLDKYQKEYLMILKHLKECSKPLKQTDVIDLEHFMGKIFKDCMDYLKKVLRADFPHITLKVIYNAEEYNELCDKFDRLYGIRPRTKAMIVGSGSFANIYIDFQNHFKGKPIDFIANLSVSYLEELVHSIDPKKSETEIQELVCSMVEGFLEVKLPDGVKNERLKYAKTCDEYNNIGKNKPK